LKIFLNNVVFGALIVSSILFAFILGRHWQSIQTELDYSQAKGQCYDTATKTRHLSKTEDGWVCFIEHWEGKRKPRITMSRLTE
jgi:hypothetical protein